MRLDSGFAGSKFQTLSRCANSPPTRPRFSQTFIRIASISSAAFSGNAARRLLRPILCSRNSGPIKRKERAPKFAVFSGSKRRTPRRTATAVAPSTACTAGFSALPVRLIVRLRKRRIKAGR
jgi:hypothetical protein